MKANDIVIDVLATTKHSPFILTGMSMWSEYNDGKKGAQLGYKYEIVLPLCKYEKLTVKVSDKNPLFPVDDDKALENTPEVRFVNLKMRVYTSNTGLGVSATADSISLVEKKGA